MATKKTVKTFSVSGRFTNLDISIDIQAPDLETALCQAREKKFSDFIDTQGEVFDYQGPEIRSVWEND